MKKNKKKLPRFYLGTRLGYQPNYGIGNYQFSSDPGESVEPETNAIKRNIVPSALNKLQSTSLFALNALSNSGRSMATGASLAANTAAVNAASAGGVGARLLQPGAGTDYMGSMITSGGENLLREGGKQGATTAGKTALGTLGTITAGLGTLYGGIDMGMLIASNKDHRTAADMRNTLTTNTYTTDYGNAYTTHTGLDRSAELDYARKQRLSKNLNFTATSIGTGMSAGALIGSTVGSVAPGVGTAIGAGVGALGGGLAYLLGLGDTEDETNAAMDRLTDVTAMGDRMSYSLAKDKDSKQGFYSKTRPDGSMGAALGKTPTYYTGKKPNARVSRGETNVHRDGTYEVYPGKPDTKDSLTRHVANSDTIFSNNNILTGESASQYFLRTNDYYGALAMDETNRNFIKENNIKNGMLHARCGKMPRYELGTPGEYALATLPHLGLFFTSLAQYNIDRKADVHTPSWQGDNAAGAAAINQLYSDMIDPRQYLNRSDRNYAMAAWNARRTPGLGLGGRAVLLDSLYRGKLALDAETLMKINEANRTLRNTAANMKYNYGDKLLGLNYDNFWKSEAFKLQAYGAKDNRLIKDRYNITIPLINASGDLLKMIQANRASEIKDKMIGLYENNQNLDWYRLRMQYPDSQFWNWNSTQGTKTSKQV